VEARLPDRVERDVMRSDEVEWLRLWAHQGWMPCGSPVICHRSVSGDEVLRHTLVPRPSVEWEPSIPWIEPGARPDFTRRPAELPGTSLVPARHALARLLITVTTWSGLAQRHGQHELPMEA
jgi:hypothetical protein